MDHHLAVEVVLPVYNEEEDLEASVCRLRSYLDEHFPFPALVTIADNASTDGTWPLARRLAATWYGVRALRLEEKGRGRALKTVWSASEADVVAYMDVDLATGLDALLPLVAPLLSGHSDLAIGTRLAAGARVVRGPRRELISRAYNALVRLALANRFSDAQCGFKALRSDVARALLPHVVDNGWFFDTELLVLAERNGLRIAEVPVDWVDDPDSSVDVARTAIEDLKGLARMRRELSAGAGRADLSLRRRGDPLSTVGRFARIGAVCTVAFLALFLLLRQPLGAYGAAATSLCTCTAINTALHWRLASGDARRPAALRLGAAGLAVNLAATTLALACADAVDRRSELDLVVALLIGLAPAAIGRLLLVRALDDGKPGGHPRDSAASLQGASR